MEGAGFIHDGESPMLMNRADDRQGNVFDPAIKIGADPFVLRFGKP